MIPLAPTAADTHHSSTANFLFSVPSNCPGCCAIKRAPGVSFFKVTHGEG